MLIITETTVPADCLSTDNPVDQVRMNAILKTVRLLSERITPEEKFINNEEEFRVVYRFGVIPEDTYQKIAKLVTDSTLSWAQQQCLKKEIYEEMQKFNQTV